MTIDSPIGKEYPIDLKVEGWSFRCTEVSVGHYDAEGTDLKGRTASISDGNPEELLSRCADMARGINAQLAARKQA